MIRLFSLNIEGDRHINRIIPFLQKEKADVVCFQEVFKADIPLFEKTLGMKAHFTPTMDIRDINPYLSPKGLWGLGIFTNQKSALYDEYYYVGDKSRIQLFVKNNPNSGNRAVSWTRFELNGKKYHIATTHFTWSPNGEATVEQQIAMDKLLIQLKQIEPIILCGDFNAPRGKQIFKMLSDIYVDNIPAEIMTTIDKTLHREGNLGYVVDGLFTTPNYKTDDVQIIGSLSDHMGIRANIT